MPHQHWWQPHGHCFFWDPAILWLTTLSHLAIFLAYLSIVILLARFGCGRGPGRVQAARWFILFIDCCGLSHGLAMATLYHPWYRLEGAVLALTGVVSLAAVFFIGRDLRRLQRSDVRALVALLTGKTNETLHRAPVALFRCDSKGRITYCNQRYLAMTGFLDVPEGKLWCERVEPQDRPRVLNSWRSCLSTSDDCRIESRFCRPNGSLVPFLCQIFPLHEESGGFVGVVQERRVLEHLETMERHLRA